MLMDFSLNVIVSARSSTMATEESLVTCQAWKKSSMLLVGYNKDNIDIITAKNIKINAIIRAK